MQSDKYKDRNPQKMVWLLSKICENKLESRVQRGFQDEAVRLRPPHKFEKLFPAS
jgi:hypothetical protein